MGYTRKTKEYVIDLNLPPEDRWAEVLRNEGHVAEALAQQAECDLEEHLSPLVIKALSAVGGIAYKALGGPYVEEIRSWAGRMNVSFGKAVALNCTYELSHLNPSTIYGCTAAVRYVKNQGMVHVRSMDWPLSEIGNATRVFRFRKGAHEFVSVGMVGFVGVLSGMVPGGYSVTINWAPPTDTPRFDMAPAFLLRDVLENCLTYDEAVEALCTTTLATSVFYTVCGTKEGQACIVERTSDEYSVREIGSSEVLSQANHHVLKEFKDNNDEMKMCVDNESSLFEDSMSRMTALKKSLGKIKKFKSLVDTGDALDVSPVVNEDAYQQMVFCPATGQFVVWRDVA